jgi:hypothetical protein
MSSLRPLPLSPPFAVAVFAYFITPRIGQRSECCPAAISHTGMLGTL